MAAASAIARRAFADARVRSIAFAALFFASAVTQATAYREGYPTRAERLDFARSIGANDAARMLYGAPHDLLSVGGYVSWRVGGSLAVFAALWGLLGAVRALRAEEDAARTELLLANAVGRRRLYLAQLAGVAGGALVLWLALFAALVIGELPAGGSAYLALAVVSVVPVFAGVGAVASQLAPSKRIATGIAAGVLMLAFALRTAASVSADLDWLRWATPLGWSEELRPFVDPQPLVLLLPAASAAVLLVVAGALWIGRDVGSGLLPARDSARPNPRLLGSPAGHALRMERGALLAWLVGIGLFAVLMGFLSGAVTPDVLSENVREQLEKLGSDSVATPAGWLGFAFVFFILAVSIFCCMQVASLRSEEAEQRLETLLSLPVSRVRWLAGRLLVAAAGAALLALAAGLLAWAGAATQGADVSLLQLLGAGANVLPTALLFLALGGLAFALAPRAAAPVAYGLVGLSFVWELFGALLELPAWLLALSPFHNVALVPGEPFAAGAAAITLALTALAGLAAFAVLGRRDLVGA
jgi:ABC-2 type transport system permease protein